ncbi:MAG: DUF4177 domain-containing protein [Methanoregulaceae archaeon]
MSNICSACGKTHEAATFCPYCNTPVKKEIIKTGRIKDTPENRAKGLKEYKVIGQEDEWLNGGRFDKTSLQNMLNYYANQGWIVKEISASKSFGIFFGTPRDEMIIILERDLFLDTSKLERIE